MPSSILLKARGAAVVPFSDTFDRYSGGSGRVGNGWYPVPNLFNQRNRPMSIASGAALGVANGYGYQRDVCISHRLTGAPSLLAVDLVGAAGSAGRNPWIFLGTPTNGVGLSIDVSGTWIIWTTINFVSTNRASGNGATGGVRVTLSKSGNVYTAKSGATTVATWTDTGNVAVIDPAITLYCENDTDTTPMGFSFDNLTTDQGFARPEVTATLPVEAQWARSDRNAFSYVPLTITFTGITYGAAPGNYTVNWSATIADPPDALSYDSGFYNSQFLSPYLMNAAGEIVTNGGGINFQFTSGGPRTITGSFGTTVNAGTTFSHFEYLVGYDSTSLWWQIPA